MKHLLLVLSLWIGAIACSSFDPIQVMCEINGFMIPAIIDTGAEITVMSAACAKRCQLSNTIDTKYSGKAIGVGSSEILGGIDDLAFRIGPINFQNKVSVLRSSRCDLLLGLDVLRRFHSEINLTERVLKLSVRDNQVRIPILPGIGASRSAPSPKSTHSASTRTLQHNEGSRRAETSGLFQRRIFNINGQVLNEATTTLSSQGEILPTGTLLEDVEGFDDEEFDDAEYVDSTVADGFSMEGI